MKAAFLQIGMESMNHPIGSIFIKGIFAGWLIALMVWQLPVAEAGRIHVIIIITYIVGLGELSHIIAGSVEAIYTVAAHHHTWGDYLFRWALPTLLGNVFGGVALVAAVNYAQVEAGQD